MQNFLTVIHIVTCILLILVVLIQSGKGAEISASLGGSSQTVFGSSGGANFFTRFTSGAAAVFMVTSVALTILGSRNQTSVFAGQHLPAKPPAAPAQPKAPTPVDVPSSNAGGASVPAQTPGTK